MAINTGHSGGPVGTIYTMTGSVQQTSTTELHM